MRIVKKVFDHDIPTFLKAYPKSIHLIHWLQRLLYIRNAHIYREIKKNDPNNHETVWDVGCGDGQFSIYELYHTKHTLVGTDRNKKWLDFLTKFTEKTGRSSFQFHVLGEDAPIALQFDRIYCFAVLPFVENVADSFETFRKCLNENGVLHVYVPINFKIEIPLYKSMFKKFHHAEKGQNRKQIFTKVEILNYAKSAGLKPMYIRETYGFYGRIGHEMWSITTMLLGSSKILHNVLGILITIPVFIVLQITKFVDLKQIIKNGNGLYVTFQKNIS